MPSLQGRNTLAYPVEKVFATAMEIETFPDILPYIKDAKVICRGENTLLARVTLGLSAIKFSYDCTVTYTENESIIVTSDERMFESFKSVCVFERLSDTATIVRYRLDCRFTNPVLELLSRAVIPVQSKGTLHALEAHLRRR